ncbi:MAG: type II secretion system F family protein [Bdellovibrionota bacterium]
MPIFVYKGYESKTGKNCKGKIEAVSLREARQRLKTREKIIVSDIKEETNKAKKSGSSGKSKTKVKLTDLAIMTRQFATLQQAHVPLDESLKALVGQVENAVLGNALSSVKDMIQEGKSLGDSTKEFPGIFNRLFTNMVHAGEQSGTLGLVLERLADFMEYQVKVRGQVFSALSYPALMIGASFLIIGYLFVSVVPKLQKVFDSLKVTLPWYTKTLIQFSEFIQSYWYLLLIGVVLIYFAFKSWYSSDKGRLKFDRFILGVPVFGPIIMRVNVSGFTRTLSTLLGSGVPIISALEITKNTIGNRIISDVVEAARIAVQEGESLGQVIERSGEFPSLVTHMIKTGEKTGELETMLNHVAIAYDAEVERKISSMIAMIEPAMIIVMGAIVVVVVVAMLVPMLSVMSQMR